MVVLTFALEYGGLTACVVSWDMRCLPAGLAADFVDYPEVDEPGQRLFWMLDVFYGFSGRLLLRGHGIFLQLGF